jgi:hypothetical protein
VELPVRGNIEFMRNDSPDTNYLINVAVYGQVAERELNQSGLSPLDMPAQQDRISHPYL